MVSKSNKYNPTSPRLATIYNERYRNNKRKSIYKGIQLTPKSQERRMEDIEARNHKNSIKKMEEEMRTHLQEIRPSQRQLKKQKNKQKRLLKFYKNCKLKVMSRYYNPDLDLSISTEYDYPDEIITINDNLPIIPSYIVCVAPPKNGKTLMTMNYCHKVKPVFKKRIVIFTQNFCNTLWKNAEKLGPSLYTSF